MQQTVSCLICGHTAVSLARHFKAVHGITADEYRVRHPGARIRSEACEAKRSLATAKSHEAKPRKGLKKTITCPTCGAPREVGLTFAPTTHEMRCASCVEKEADAEWAALEEGEDYVTCKGCSYRAENLTSHVQNAHPEWVGCYPGPMVAARSAVRDKTALKGRPLSDSIREKMSVNAGRWNKGLTKETDSRVAAQADHRKGYPSWSKGHTKETHPSLQSTSEKLSAYKGPNRSWSNGLKADLSEVDFTPYLDETGAVDRKSMAEALGLSEPTVTKYMEDLGLRLSTKYVDARVSASIASGHLLRMNEKTVERSTIRLTPEQLEPFKQKDGKVMIGRAMRGLGHVYAVIRRECDRLRIPTRETLVKQGICLQAVSEALGGMPFQQEWESMQFINPPSGRRFRFDGYFPSHNLVVEFHGYQHWVFPSVYIRDEAAFLALQERDRVKARLVQGDPVLRYFEVHEDEPYADVAYLRHRLLDEGIFDP